MLPLSKLGNFSKVQACIILLTTLISSILAFAFYWQDVSQRTFIFMERNVSSMIDHKPTDHPNHRISVVIINWVRPNNVKLILQNLVEFDEIENIVVIMANPASAFTYLHPKVRHMVNYSISDKWGVAVRIYACAYETQHHRVLLLDDDLLLSHEDIWRLMAVTATDRRPVCFKEFGRIKRYTRNKTHFDRRPNLMCLTRAVLIDRSFCHEFFRFAPLMKSFIEKNSFRMTTHWNGEDIFLALVHLYVSNGSSIPFFLEQSNHRELPSNGAISSNPRHTEYRYAFLDEAANQLNLSQHSPFIYWEQHWQIIHKKLQENRTVYGNVA